ncbi:MAG: hypothetical protein KF771_11300 [Burkholderiales bacterium]|nr:hypothetical protein [Burkholderiales bacterium]
MNSGARLAATAGALCAMLFGAAFLVRRLPCGQDLETWLALGLAVLLLLLALPWIMHRNASVLARSGCSAAALVAGIATWVAGFHFAGIPLLCRLF